MRVQKCIQRKYKSIRNITEPYSENQWNRQASSGIPENGGTIAMETVCGQSTQVKKNAFMVRYVFCKDFAVYCKNLQSLLCVIYTNTPPCTSSGF